MGGERFAQSSCSSYYCAVEVVKCHRWDLTPLKVCGPSVFFFFAMRHPVYSFDIKCNERKDAVTYLMLP